MGPFLLINRILGHYKILRQLGAGGMGEVYEASDTKLGRKVALKVLPGETARDPKRRERFEREAKAVAALNHPNIVTIYSIEEAEGVGFMTMEMVEGQTLRDVLMRGGMPLAKLLEIAIPLAEAVAAAHQQGITHRDLKPENVLVGRDGKVKVLDFGLAKMTEAVGAPGEGSQLPTRVLTEEGRIVGTVAYMSPEQAEGKPIDPRSDVFALGIVLYEMATGERPFKGDSTVSLLSSILRDTPVTVSQVNAALPRDLARIVDRCLIKDPARRFQTAMGLATELARLKKDSDSGELLAFGGGGRRAGKIAYAAVAVLAAGIAVAAVVVMRRSRSAPHGDATVGSSGLAGVDTAHAEDGRERIVVLPFENLGTPDDAYFAAGMTEEITSRLAAVRGLGVISRTSAVQYASTGKTAKQIGQELGVHYVLEGTVRWERGGSKSGRVRVTPQLIRVADDTHVWADRYDREMKDIFAVQSEIAEQVVAKMGVAVHKPEHQAIGAQPTGNLDAYQAYLRGREQLDSVVTDRGDKAAELLQKAVELDPRFALAWAFLSKAHSTAYQFRVDFTEERLAKARECADKALALQPDLAAGHLALGYYYYWGRGDYDQALQEFHLAAGGMEGDPEILEAVAYIRRRQGHWDEAIAGMEKAYSLNPRNAALASQLSGTFDYLGRYPEAIRFSDVAIGLDPDADELKIGKAFLQLKLDGDTRAMRRSMLQMDLRRFPDRPGLESYVDMMEGRYKEALDHLAQVPDEALETQTSYFPKPLLVGFAYLAMKDASRARVACESARQVLEKEIARSPRDPRVRIALGLTLACLDRKEEAVREGRLAVDLSPVASDALSGPDYLGGLAQVYAMTGDTERSLDLLEKLLSMPSGTSLNFLRLDPLWASLWKLPRFRQLKEKHS